MNKPVNCLANTTNIIKEVFQLAGKMQQFVTQMVTDCKLSAIVPAIIDKVALDIIVSRLYNVH